MTTGLQRLLARALTSRLRADAGVTALVPATSVYRADTLDVVPTFPFIKLGAAVTQPRRAACVVGGDVSIDIHAFARRRENGSGGVVESGEDHASRIGAAIEACLAPNVLTLEGGETAKIRLSDIRLLQDDEPGAFHWFAQINARVLAQAS